jgi:hypothetical protein
MRFGDAEPRTKPGWIGARCVASPGNTSCSAIVKLIQLEHKWTHPDDLTNEALVKRNGTSYTQSISWQADRYMHTLGILTHKSKIGRTNCSICGGHGQPWSCYSTTRSCYFLARARSLSLCRYRCLRSCLCLSKAPMGNTLSFPQNALSELSSVDQRTCDATSMWSNFSDTIDSKNKRVIWVV